MSIEEARVFLPEGAIAEKDQNENRWRLRLEKPKVRVTRAWPTRGEFESFRDAARDFWRQYEMITGEACPVDWIMDGEIGAECVLGLNF